MEARSPFLSVSNFDAVVFDSSSYDWLVRKCPILENLVSKIYNINSNLSRRCVLSEIVLWEIAKKCRTNNIDVKDRAKKAIKLAYFLSFRNDDIYDVSFIPDPSFQLCRVMFSESNPKVGERVDEIMLYWRRLLEKFVIYDDFNSLNKLGEWAEEYYIHTQSFAIELISKTLERLKKTISRDTIYLNNLLLGKMKNKNEECNRILVEEMLLGFGKLFCDRFRMRLKADIRSEYDIDKYIELNEPLLEFLKTILSKKLTTSYKGIQGHDLMLMLLLYKGGYFTTDTKSYPIFVTNDNDFLKQIKHRRIEDIKVNYSLS